MKLDIQNVKNFKLVRRDFLKLSSASVVAPALAGGVVTMKPMPAFGFSAPPVVARSPRVSIGYWDGRLSSSFIDAREIDAADDHLANGVGVRVVGCCGDDGVSTWEDFRSLSLGFSLLPTHDGEMRAWQYESVPVANVSSLAAFTLPTDTAAGITGWIEYRNTDAQSKPARVPFRLGFDGADGMAKLRSGHYVFVVRQPGSLWNVDWATLELRVTDGGNALSLHHRDGRHFDQFHIVVEIYPA